VLHVDRIDLVLSYRPCSPVFEQGNTFGKTPMIDLSSSSDEGNFIAYTSRDVELVKKIFGELNRDILKQLVTARSLSSMILMKKMRHRRRRLSASNLRQLLLPLTWSQVLPLVPTMLLQGRRSIIVMIRGLIKRLMAADVASVSLRLSCQE
jgi:hypothetical protein